MKIPYNDIKALSFKLTPFLGIKLHVARLLMKCSKSTSGTFFLNGVSTAPPNVRRRRTEEEDAVIILHPVEGVDCCSAIYAPQQLLLNSQLLCSFQMVGFNESNWFSGPATLYVIIGKTKMFTCTVASIYTTAN